MKISLKWLNEYVEIKDHLDQPAELSKKLTEAGLEVESIEDRRKQFQGVVVGHLLEVGKHPNADRLTLCQVSTGNGVVHQIVCGAKNHKTGDRVVVALPGAVLPGDFAIKQTVIRGVESGGMLCSQKELGLSTESEGIMILPESAVIGQPFSTYMGFDDVVFVLKVTPNRADCLSHYGLARELSTLLDRPLKFPKPEVAAKAFAADDSIKVEIVQSDLCARYSGRILHGVKVGPSPAWLKQRLESVGAKSINNIVDIGNFVMLELGQPLHAFDLDTIKGTTFKVDFTQQGEEFISFDGTKFKLTGQEIAIRDAERTICLGGVVGARDTGVTELSKNIFFEAANFQPQFIRRTSKRFNIDTDAAYRFARGVNPELTVIALNRACQLVAECAAGEVSDKVFDLYPRAKKTQPIQMNLETLESRLGYQVSKADFLKWMQRLDCQVEESGDTFKVTPPIYRQDISIDMDLVEEFARLNGYQHIPDAIPEMAMLPTRNDFAFDRESKLRQNLAALGCLEAVNYEFVSSTWQDSIVDQIERWSSLGLSADRKAVSIRNPLNEELNVMRLSLLPGLVRNAERNMSFMNAVGRIFELGFSHTSSDSGSPPLAPSGGSYFQRAHLGLAFWGAPLDIWRKQATPQVFQLKATIEGLLQKMNVRSYQWVTEDQDGSSVAVPTLLHPKQAAVLYVGGRPAGFCGTLHPEWAAKLKVREEVAIAEFAVDALLAAAKDVITYRPISRFPPVERDLAFVMPTAFPAGRVADFMRQVAGHQVRELKIFDVFTGESLPPGHKSVAYRLVFQAANTTLEDKDINSVRDELVKQVRDKFAFSLR